MSPATAGISRHHAKTLLHYRRNAAQLWLCWDKIATEDNWLDVK